jgi:hypothetical protein
LTLEYCDECKCSHTAEFGREYHGRVLRNYDAIFVARLAEAVERAWLRAGSWAGESSDLALLTWAEEEHGEILPRARVVRIRRTDAPDTSVAPGDDGEEPDVSGGAE